VPPDVKQHPWIESYRATVSDPEFPPEVKAKARELAQKRAQESGLDFAEIDAWASAPEASVVKEPAGAPDNGVPLVQLDDGPATPSAPETPRPPARYDPSSPEDGWLSSARMPDYVYEPRRNPGESDEHYQARADAAWQKEYDAAQMERRPVARYADTEGIERLGAGALGYLGSIAYNASRGLTGGIADRVAGLANPEARDRLVKTAENADLPGLDWIGLGTRIGTAIAPGSLGNQVAGPIIKMLHASRPAVQGLKGTAALAEGATRVAQALPAAGLAGAADSVATSGVDAAFNAAQGLPQQESLKGATQRALATGAASMALLPPLAAAQHAGLAAVTALRKGPIGPLINNMERAGGELGFLGLRPPPDLERARELQALPRADKADIVKDPSLRKRGTDAVDQLTDDAAEAMHREMAGYHEANKASISAGKTPYLTHPVADERRPAEPVVVALMQRITANTDEAGRPFPGYEDLVNSDLQLLGAFQRGEFRAPGSFDADSAITVDEARKRGIPLDDDAMAERGLAASGGVVTQDRPLNARELEIAIDNYTRTNSNKREASVLHEGDDLVLRELIKMREQFPDMPADAAAAAGVHPNWAENMRQQHQKMKDFEATAAVAGIDRKVKKIDPEDAGQRQQIFNAVRQYHGAGKSRTDDIRAFDRFVAARPELERKLDALAGGRDTTLLEGRGEEAPGNIAVGPGGVRAFTSGVTGRLARWLGMRLDSTAQAVGGVRRTNDAMRKNDPGLIEDTIAYKAGAALSGRKPGRTPNGPTPLRKPLDAALDTGTYYPDKLRGRGKSTARAATVGTVAVHDDDAAQTAEFLNQWLNSNVRAQRKKRQKQPGTAVSGER
jgi:hypothetical protein